MGKRPTIPVHEAPPASCPGGLPISYTLNGLPWIQHPNIPIGPCIPTPTNSRTTVTLLFIGNCTWIGGYSEGGHTFAFTLQLIGPDPMLPPHWEIQAGEGPYSSTWEKYDGATPIGNYISVEGCTLPPTLFVTP